MVLCEELCRQSMRQAHVKHRHSRPADEIPAEVEEDVVLARLLALDLQRAE